MPNIWSIENVDMYEILCPHKLEKYGPRHFRSYQKGEIIYHENETAQFIYMVSSGKVRLVHYNDQGEEMVKAILTPGELFGEMALLGEEKRTDFALAVSDQTQICPVTVDNIRDLMRDHSGLSLTIHKYIGQRMQKLERRLTSLFFKDTRQRLVEFVYDLAKDQGTAVDEEITIKHFYTQKDIADLIGARRETVTHLFKELKAENLIEYKRSTIIIMAPGAIPS